MKRFEMYVDLPNNKCIVQAFKAWPSKAREVAARIAREMGGRVAWHTLRACA